MVNQHDNCPDRHGECAVGDPVCRPSIEAALYDQRLAEDRALQRRMDAHMEGVRGL